MERSDYPKLVQAMTVLAENLSETIGHPKHELFWEALQPYAWSEIEPAFAQALRQKWYRYPQTGEIIELIEGSQDDKSEIAWRRFWELFDRYSLSRFDSLLFEDYALYEAIIDTFQTWEIACTCPRPSEDVMVEHQMYRKNFMAAYRRALRKPRNQGRAYLIGAREKTALSDHQTWGARVPLSEPNFVMVPREGAVRVIPLKSLRPHDPLVALYETARRPALVGEV